MTRLVVQLCVVASGLLACNPTASVEPTASSPTVAPEPVGTRYARVDTFSLYPDPVRSAAQVQIQPDPSRGGGKRVVELLEATPDGSWARVRTLLPREAVGLGLEPSEGVAMVRLRGWIETYQLVEFEPGPSSTLANGSDLASVPTKSEIPPPAPAKLDVGAGTVLRWPDGRAAGEVVERHGFFSPGMRVSEDGDHSLICHDRRAAPGVGVVRGWLCTTDSRVPDANSIEPDLIMFDEPLRSGTTSESTGTMDREVIREVVRSNIEQVRDCYNGGLRIDPTVAGRVMIEFVIGNDGSIRSATVVEDLPGAPAIGACIAKAVQDWKFPRVEGAGDITVVYPFNLTQGT